MCLWKSQCFCPRASVGRGLGAGEARQSCRMGWLPLDGGNTTIIQITQMAEPPALILQFPLICTTGELLYATRARTATRGHGGLDAKYVSIVSRLGSDTLYLIVSRVLDRLSGCQCCSALDATRRSLVRRVHVQLYGTSKRMRPVVQLYRCLANVTPRGVD